MFFFSPPTLVATDTKLDCLAIDGETEIRPTNKTAWLLGCYGRRSSSRHSGLLTEHMYVHDWTCPSVSLAAARKSAAALAWFTSFCHGTLLRGYLYNLPLLIPSLGHIGRNIQDSIECEDGVELMSAGL